MFSVSSEERRIHLDTPLPAAPDVPRSSRTKYPLTNMLYCPYCGEKLIHKWSNRVREYWACKTNIKVSAAACKGIWLPVQ
ncbi:MAG: zinc ribbon domain-containing protein [Flavonifractor plautii]